MRTEKLRSYQHIEQDTYRTFEYIHIFFAKEEEPQKNRKEQKKVNFIGKVANFGLSRARELSKHTFCFYSISDGISSCAKDIIALSHTHSLSLFLYYLNDNRICADMCRFNLFAWICFQWIELNCKDRFLYLC